MPKYRTPYLDESTFTVHQEYAPEYDTAPPPITMSQPPQSTRRVRSGVRTEYMRNMYCKSAHRVHAKYMLSTLAVRAEYTRSTYRVHELYSVTTLRPRLRRRRRLRLRRLIRPRLLRLLILPIDTGLEHFRNHFSSFFSLSSLATLALLVSCGWERGRVLGKCATYELSTTCYTCLRQRGAPPLKQASIARSR